MKRTTATAMSKVGHAVYRKVDCEQKVLVYSSCAV